MKIDKLLFFIAANPCEDSNILNIIFYIRKIMEIAFIVIPIVLIVLITFDFVKNVMAGNEDAMKKNQKIVIKRIVYCIAMFFVMPITNLAFSAFETSGQKHLISDNNGVNYLSCWANAKDKETIKSFEKTVEFDPNGGSLFGDRFKKCYSSGSCEVVTPNTTKKGYIFKGWSNDGGNTMYKTGQKIAINDGDVYKAIWDTKPEEEKVPTNEEILDKENESSQDKTPSSNITPSTGAFIGTKYNLTDAELKGLAYLCQKEQGDAEGAAYEAALIANRFELFPQGWDNIAEYAAEQGWWNHGYEYVYNPGSVDSDVLEAVKDVLVNGNRPMPQYIDEHDCIWCGDYYGWNVEKIVTDGKTINQGDSLLERSNYVTGKTESFT